MGKVSYVSLVPCTRVPWQCSEVVLGPSLTTGTPSMCHPHWGLNREPSSLQPELPGVSSLCGPLNLQPCVFITYFTDHHHK